VWLRKPYTVEQLMAVLEQSQAAVEP
jgi:hypothetical protein